jgi:chromosome segregation ATPase
MTWIFATIIIVSAGYLTHMVFSLLSRVNLLRPKLQFLDQQIEEQQDEWQKYELTTLETERKISFLEEEALKYERRISDLQIRINAQVKRQEKAAAAGKVK